jgi:hypothetical protein
MAIIHSYIVRYDSGFAPNPFYGFCTLATCKPDIRKHAQVGDWIVGTGSKQINRGGHLVYAMQVAETLSFEAYSSDPRFERKKPRLAGSYKMAAGDNIYEPTAIPGRWRQLNSYHSKKDGNPNPDHIKRDTSVSRVLISPVPQFVYFGAEGPLVPHELSDAGVVFSGRGRKKITDQAVTTDFADWFGSLGVTGYQGRPHDMLKDLKTQK